MTDRPCICAECGNPVLPNLCCRFNKIRWQQDLARRGQERKESVSPQLAEALRIEIRTALDAGGEPFDVNVARRVYDLAIAARDMCVAATGTVKEAIDQIKDTNGPMETLDAPDTPESAVQASETLFPNANTEFERYFESLGYTVSYEGQMGTGERWYEICDDDGLAFQISMPPIAELIDDLPHLIEKKRGVGSTDYWFACKDDGKLRELLRRATERLS